jgi:hypothetical protein
MSNNTKWFNQRAPPQFMHSLINVQNMHMLNW